MRCPVCEGNVRTIDSRTPKKNPQGRRIEGNTVFRRKECKDCLTRFDTNETIIMDSLPDYVKEKCGS